MATGHRSAPPSQALWSARPARSGITLLEVLISIFVLSVGLFGVAALIPVGRQQIEQGSKYDRAATASRAAMSELLARDWLSPDMWMNYQGNAYGPVSSGAAFPPVLPYTQPAAWPDMDEPTGTLPVGTPGVNALGQLTSPITAGNSVCIDPLFLAAVPNVLAGAAFPVVQFNDPDQDDDNDDDLTNGDIWPNPPRMQRATVRGWAPGQAFVSPPALGLPIARRQMTWQDEMVFNLPTDGTRRPEWQGELAQGAGSMLRQQTAGDYTWFATVTPSPGEASNSPDAMRTFTVATVVVYKRDLAYWAREGAGAVGVRPPPKERMLYCNFLWGSQAGGEVELILPIVAGDANTNPGRPDRSDMPKIRPGQWIMLAGWTQPDPLVPVLPPVRRAVYKWYRVAAVGPLPIYNDPTKDFFNPVRDPLSTPINFPNGSWSQEITLQGADWNQASVEIDLPGLIPPFGTYAVIVDGVVGVYETTLTLRP